MGRTTVFGVVVVKQVRLRQQLRWYWPSMAAFLGVSQSVLWRWENGERNPSGVARRLIWLLDLLAREPDSLKTGFDLIVWGRGKNV